MSRKLNKPLSSGKEYVEYCRGHKAVKNMRVAGDHFTFETDEGRATICNSKREMPFWLRKKVYLELLAIGLGLYFMVFILPAFI